MLGLMWYVDPRHSQLRKGWRKIKFVQYLTAYAVRGGWVGGSPCRLGNCTNFRSADVWPDRMGGDCNFDAGGSGFES